MFNWLQLLSRILKNSVGSDLIELQMSMYYLMQSSLLIQNNCKNTMPILVLGRWFCAAPEIGL